MGYHTGCVWPHDNALIAAGLARYGLVEEAMHILTALAEAGMHLDLQRMPELVCGFPRQHGEPRSPTPSHARRRPGRPPRCSCSFRRVWAWRSAAPTPKCRFTRPQWPAGWAELRIRNLAVAGATVDLLLVRDEHHVDVG